MPRTKSVKKSLRSSLRKREYNLIWKKKMEQALKKANHSNLSSLFSILDKTSQRNVISKNKAARLKSRLSKKFAQKLPKSNKKGVVQGAKPPTS